MQKTLSAVAKVLGVLTILIGLWKISPGIVIVLLGMLAVVFGFGVEGNSASESKGSDQSE